jgi:putative transcription factor
MYEHQDWTPVIIRGKKPGSVQHKTQATTRVAHVTSSTTGKPAWAIEKKIDNPDAQGPLLNCVSKDTARLITQGRVAKKMTQNELAQAINVPPAIIKEIEAGKAIENKQLLANIRRVLGLQKT